MYEIEPGQSAGCCLHMATSPAATTRDLSLFGGLIYPHLRTQDTRNPARTLGPRSSDKTVLPQSAAAPASRENQTLAANTTQ